VNPDEDTPPPRRWPRIVLLAGIVLLVAPITAGFGLLALLSGTSTTQAVQYGKHVIDGTQRECGRVDEGGGSSTATLWYWSNDQIGPGDEYPVGPIRRDVVDPPLENGDHVRFMIDGDRAVTDVRRSACDPRSPAAS
jgi:hypothetical protein